MINGSAVEVNSTAETDNADGFTTVGVITTNSAINLFCERVVRISNGKLNTQSHGLWLGRQ